MLKSNAPRTPSPVSNRPFRLQVSLHEANAATGVKTENVATIIQLERRLPTRSRQAM